MGIVTDNPEQKTSLKTFHSEIQNDHETIKREEANYRPIPIIEEVTAEDVRENYLKIKRDVRNLVSSELQKLIISENTVVESKKQSVKKRGIPSILGNGFNKKVSLKVTINKSQCQSSWQLKKRHLSL